MSKIFAFAAGVLLSCVCIFTSGFAIAAEDPSFAILSKTPWLLESVSASSVCGSIASKPNSRQCLGSNTYEIFANDTVSKLDQFLLGDGALCGVDERGPRCWRANGVFEKPVRTILSEGDAKRALLANEMVCVPQKDHTVHCYRSEQGSWVEAEPGSGKNQAYIRSIPPKEVFGPFPNLRTFDPGERSFCALDGDEVKCQPYKYGNTAKLAVPIPGELSYPGAKGISTKWDSVCVLWNGGLDCTIGNKPEELVKYHVEGSWLKAVKLFRRGYNTICAVDKDETPMCVQLTSTANEVKDVTPSELVKPEIRVVKFKAEAEAACAMIENRTTLEKSFLCGDSMGNMRPSPFGKDVVDFEVSKETNCVKNSLGIVTCFTGSTNLDSPLPEDGSSSHSSGRCRWNSSRFHCSATPIETDFSEIAKVVDVTEYESFGLPCFIYENRSGIRQVKCFGSGETLSQAAPPIELDAVKIAATYNHACLYGGQNTTCWGQPLGDQQQPNLSNVRKIAFGNSFGCATDEFGFVCWGARMDERGLNVPQGLGDLDSVRSFGVGANHACAITRDNRVICWGQNEQDQTNVPPLTNPTSIVVSGNTNCVSSDEGVTCWGYREGGMLTKGQLAASRSSNTGAAPF